MSIAVLTLGMLAFWATSVTDHHTRDLARAGHQISGHLRAAQALGQIDTHTDLLEDGLDPRIMRKLRGAQGVLDDSLRRMQERHVDPRERALARDAEPHVRRLRRTVESYLAAVPSSPNEPSVGGSRAEIRNVTDTEERMETALDELQLRFNDVTWDPVQLLTRETAGAAEDERAVHRTGLFLIPLGLLFVALCGWQLRTYRKRSEEVMLAALQDSEVDARTDHLTGLGNRRALMEELERRISEGQECTLALADLNGFKHYNDSFGHAAGDSLLARVASNLKRACGDRGLPVRLGGDEFCVLFDVAGSREQTLALVQDALAEDGEGFRVTSACGLVRIPDEAADASAILRIADIRMYAAKALGRTTVEHQMCEMLSRMLEARHPGLGEHVANVTRLATACATMLDLAPEQIHDVQRAAKMHDIGKVAIPESIINKPGPLTPEEWVFMRTHPAVGERILSAVPAMESAAELVRSSHERWDGEGYPNRLTGELIPIGARIVAVADAFSAMTEERTYRRPRSKAAALDELRRCAGTQFDPRVVDAFIEAFESTPSEPQLQPELATT